MVIFLLLIEPMLGSIKTSCLFVCLFIEIIYDLMNFTFLMNDYNSILVDALLILYDMCNYVFFFFLFIFSVGRSVHFFIYSCSHVPKYVIYLFLFEITDGSARRTR